MHWLIYAADTYDERGSESSKRMTLLARYRSTFGKYLNGTHIYIFYFDWFGEQLCGKSRVTKMQTGKTNTIHSIGECTHNSANVSYLVYKVNPLLLRKIPYNFPYLWLLNLHSVASHSLSFSISVYIHLFIFGRI